MSSRGIGGGAFFNILVDSIVVGNELAEGAVSPKLSSEGSPVIDNAEAEAGDGFLSNSGDD